MQMEPTIGAAALAVCAYERAPAFAPRDGFVLGLGFDRGAARRDFERSPFLRATRLRHRIAPAQISLRGGGNCGRKACFAPALGLERLNSLEIRERVLWNQDPDLNHLSVDFANGIPFAGARIELRRFALRFSRRMRGRELDQQLRVSGVNRARDARRFRHAQPLAVDRSGKLWNRTRLSRHQDECVGHRFAHPQRADCILKEAWIPEREVEFEPVDFDERPNERRFDCAVFARKVERALVQRFLFGR